MNSRRLILVTICAALGPYVAAAESNLVSNAGFEVDGIGVPGWTVTAGTTRYSIVQDPVRGGSVIEGTEAEPGGSLGRLLQRIDGRFVTGDTYRLTGWIRTTDVTSPEGAVIGVGTVDADGALISGSFHVEIGNVNGTTDWTFYDSGDFVLSPLTSGAIAHAVYLDINGNGGGVARFDDLALTGRPAVPPPISRDGFAGIGVGLWVLALLLPLIGFWAFGRSKAYSRM